MNTHSEPLEANTDNNSIQPSIDITSTEIAPLKANDDTISLCGVVAAEPKIGENKESPKLNRRQLEFCKYIVEGYSNSDSVRMSKFRCKDPSRTANYLLKRTDILHEITRQKEELRALAMMDKPSFIQLVLKHMKEAKQESTKARLLELYGSLLGYTQKDTPVQVNLMQYLDKAEAFFKVKEP
jgi:hypothetical protein